MAINVESRRPLCAGTHISFKGAQGFKDFLVASTDGDFDLAAPILSLNELCVES